MVCKSARTFGSAAQVLPLLLALLGTAAAVRQSVEHYSTITRHRQGDDLPDCVTVPSFKYKEYGQAHGRCLPSDSPGAFYFDDADKKWECWTAATAEHLRNQEEAKKHEFDGACEFKEKVFKEDEMPYCNGSPPQGCSDVTKFWGACYKESSEDEPDVGRCILRDHTAEIDRVLKGDCKSHGVQGNENELYTGACRFENKEQQDYKCDTVPITSPGGCAPEHYAACFSLIKEVNWQCFGENKTTWNPSCHTLPAPNPPGGFYAGRCIFPTAGDDHGKAADASGLEPPRPPTTTTTTTTRTTTVAADTTVTTTEQEGQPPVVSSTTVAPVAQEKNSATPWHFGGAAIAMALLGLGAVA